MQRIKELKEILSSPQKIVITTHQKPDADALGSSLGLAAYLKKHNHQVTVITPTDYPRFLFWMHGNDEVVVYEPDKHETIRGMINAADVIFCLDFSDLKRIEPLGEMVKFAGGRIVMIDHHIENKKFAHFELWDTEAAATAELVYDFICMMGDKHLVDIPTAECLYAGIMTDTGSFKHASTSSKVHRIAADLMDAGLEASRIHRYIYDTSSEDRLRFLGYALKEKLKVLKEYHTAYFAITSRELQQFNHKTGDTEGLVNYALSVEGVRFAVLMVEKHDCVKMSFRSFGDFAVNELSGKHFNGGGHKNAAGGRSELTLEETEQKFLGILPQYKEQLAGMGVREFER